MAAVERAPSEMADVPKRAVSKKAFFIHRTLVSAQQASKKFTRTSARFLADDVAALHHMGNIFQNTDIAQRVAVHRDKIGKAPGRDAAEFVVFAQ